MQDDETDARLCVSNAKGGTGKTTIDITVDTAGVVANRVEQINEDEMMLEWLEEVFSGFPVWQVRKRVALQRAFSAGASIFAYERTVDVTEVFLDIATQIDRAFGYTELKA